MDATTVFQSTKSQYNLLNLSIFKYFGKKLKSHFFEGGNKVAKQIPLKVISREQTEISFKYLESCNKITLFRLCFLCTNSGEGRDLE